MTDIASLGLEIRSDGVVVAKDRLGQLERQAGRTEAAGNTLRRVWSMSLAAMAAGAAAFGFGIAAAVKRMEDMRRMSAQVDRALKNSGNTARTSAQEIEAWADRLEASTGRAAEEIMSVSANLASFGFSRQAFFRSLELADDMSAAWGGDLKQNLEGLARALAEPEKGLAMLTKRGITFTEEQKKMIAGFIELNDLAGAQGVVFEALEAQVKGVAEAGFGGLTKAWAQTKKAWEDAFEEMVRGEGQAGDLRESLEDLASVISSPEFIGAVMGFGNLIVKIISGIAQVAVGAHAAFKDFMNFVNGTGGPGAQMPEGATNKTLFPQDYGNAEADLRRQLEWQSRWGTKGTPTSELYKGFEVGENGQFNMQATLGNYGGGFDGFDPYEGMDLGGGEAGSKKAAKAAEAYRDLVRGSREFVAQQQLEAQALGMTEEAANALRYEQDMLNQAANDNIKLTTDQRAEIAGLAQEMAAAEEATRRLTEIYNSGKQIFSSFFGDLKSGIESGKGLWQSLGDAAVNALSSIANKALEMASNGIWDMIFNSIGGMLGGGMIPGGSWNIPSGFQAGGFFPGFANGTNSAPGGLSWVGERGPELINLPRGAQVFSHQQSMAMSANQNQANDNGSMTVRLIMPEGWKAEIVDEARSGARQDTVQIVQQNEKALQNYRQNGG